MIKNISVIFVTKLEFLYLDYTICLQSKLSEKERFLLKWGLCDLIEKQSKQYKKNDILILELSRTGTHSDLFKKQFCKI